MISVQNKVYRIISLQSQSFIHSVQSNKAKVYHSAKIYSSSSELFTSSQTKQVFSNHRLLVYHYQIRMLPDHRLCKQYTKNLRTSNDSKGIQERISRQHLLCFSIPNMQVLRLQVQKHVRYFAWNPKFADFKTQQSNNLTTYPFCKFCAKYGPQQQPSSGIYQ